MKLTKERLNILLANTTSLALRFHKNTSITELFDKKNNEPETWPDEWKLIYFKSYPRLKQIPLKSTTKQNDLFLKTVMARKSNRDFKVYEITKKEISGILFYSAGVISKTDKNWDLSRRPYPSAGARYPLEVYCVVLHSKDLGKGLYHYNIKSHSLELLLDSDLNDEISRITNQDWVKETSIIFIITSILDRSKAKYGERAYRYCLIEAGHLAQNIYLISTYLGLKCCSIGGFIDKQLNNLLDFDDKKEFAIYMVGVGN